MADQVAVVADSKKPWQSKTIILNSVLGLAAVVMNFVPQAHVVSDWINSNGVLISTIWGALNIALRFITKDAISLGD